MQRKNTPRVEILSSSEVALVPSPTAENLQAAIDRMVRERVDAILAEHGAALLEPDFQSKEVSYEIQRRQTIFERRRWSLYFEKWGCRRCDTETVIHACGGYCDRCHNLLFGRLVRIKREFDAANPDKEIQRDIDRLTRRIRSARELLGPSLMPLLPETTGPSHRVEILSSSEVALVPSPTAENLQAAIDRMVRERVDAILAEHGAALLEPDFQSREVSYEIQRRQTVFERRRWSLYFQKWGCRRCDRKTVNHVAGGYCDRCHNLIFARLVRIKREFDAANPNKQIQRDIDRLTRPIRSARELLGPSLMPLLPETTGPSHREVVTGYRKRNIAAGKCAYCPRPLARNSVHYCEECLRKKRERKRKRREDFKARLRAVAAVNMKPSTGYT